MTAEAQSVGLCPLPLPIAADCLEAGLWYATRGWRVLPVRGKLPLIKKWQKRASTDEGTLRVWWERWPDANVGILTGAKSGIVVLDVDIKPHRRGDLSLLELVDRGGPICFIAHAITGSGGSHYYLHHPGGRIPNANDVHGRGLDVRGDGGFVVAPPSRHPCGGRYAWTETDATGNPSSGDKLREVNGS